MKLPTRFLLAFFIVNFLISCDSQVVMTPYIDEPVIECLLLVGKGIEHFKLTRTLPVGSQFDYNKAGITGANITIKDEFDNSTILKPSAEKPGYYRDLNFIIKPKTKYFLQLDYNGYLVTAQTVTPDTFTVSKNSDSSFVYMKDEINFHWTESEGATAYFFAVTNLDTTLDKIDGSYSPDNKTVTGTTRFILTLGTSTVVFPWLHNYYGRHEVSVYAIDDNFYQFLQTCFQDVRQLSEPVSSVKNAIGYFASGVMRCRYYRLLKP